MSLHKGRSKCTMELGVLPRVQEWQVGEAYTQALQAGGAINRATSVSNEDLPVYAQQAQVAAIVPPPSEYARHAAQSRVALVMCLCRLPWNSSATSWRFTSRPSHKGWLVAFAEGGR